MSESDTYLTNFDSKNTYRMRPAQHPEMEDALHMWYCNKRNLHIPVIDTLLIEKGKYFGDEFYGLNNVDFKYSPGWLSNFKQRFGISFHVLYGEAGIADPNIVKRDAEIHYLELLRYFESHSDYYNENDLEHFLAIKNKMDLTRDSTTVQVKLDNFLIKND